MKVFTSLPRRLQANASQTPSAEAVVDGSRRVTYAGLWRQAAAVAGFLTTRGVRPGDRVAVLLDNSIEYIAAYYGALAAGAVAVGLNASARTREISAWMEHSGARLLFASAQHVDLAQFMSATGFTTVVIDRAGTNDQWAAVLASRQADPADASPDDLAAIVYTSGTTGRPKGVALSHGNLAANADSIVAYLGLDRSDRVLNLLPFFYSYGGSVLHTHLSTGATLVLEGNLVYPQRTLARLSEERITGFPGVPSTFALLLQAADFSRFDLRSLRYLTQAGGGMPPANIERLRRALPATRLFVMYGQTEATARLTYLPPERLTQKLGSVGVPVPGVELEVRDEHDQPLPPGIVGEVCVRGPNVMMGYFNDPGATRAVLRNGWLHTGDLGHLDSEGFLFLQGRRSDMIKSGAHRISPFDIEHVVAALPEVAEVAVVGVPDDILGEAIKAVVTLKPGAVLDAIGVQRHCSEQLPRYKVPRVVQFVRALPRTSTGKIKRHQLSEVAPGA
jgi:acyl-CoA synthetase (AMP-forming)/AMP-acid ligase II